MNQHNRAHGASTPTPRYNDEGITQPDAHICASTKEPTHFDRIAIQGMAQRALTARDLTNHISVAHERITALANVLDDQLDALDVGADTQSALYALVWAIRAQADCLKAATLLEGGAA